MTPDEIAELRRLMAEATPGPWRAELVLNSGRGVKFLKGWTAKDAGVIGLAMNDGYEHQDQSLIVAAVNALPSLLELIEAER